jgi:hypothetical protein
VSHYPGVYRAKCTATADDGFVTVFIPQVFSTVPAYTNQYIGLPPSPGDLGFVSFEGGDPAFPVWHSKPSTITSGSVIVDGSVTIDKLSLFSAKGDLLVGTADGSSIVSSGYDSSVLVADSTQTSGVSWQSIGRVPQATLSSSESILLDSTHIGAMILCSSAYPLTVTVDSSTSMGVGQRIDFIQMGSGQVTVAAVGVELNGTPGLKLRTQFSSASLFCTDVDTYVLVGDLTS